MKKQNLLLALILFGLLHSTIKSQVWNYLPQINATIAAIPFVFEGEVQSVEVFAGDDNGNKLAWSSAQWNGDVGYFYDQAGNDARGYSLVKIKICKIYKGDLNPEQDLEVLIKSFTLDNIYLMRTGAGPDADTVLQFQHTPLSHDENGEYDFQLPHSSYPKKLYFCDRIDPIVPSAYTGKTFHSNFHSILEMPFNQPVYIPQPDGSLLYKNAYCALVPYAFDDQNQLQQFLNQIQTINPTPYDYCRGDGTKPTVGINEFESAGISVLVFPNPSNSSEGFKVKISNPKESKLTASLIDLSGRRILDKNLGAQKNVEFEFGSDLQNGVYFLQLNSEQRTQTIKISKN